MRRRGIAYSVASAVVVGVIVIVLINSLARPPVTKAEIQIGDRVRKYRLMAPTTEASEPLPLLFAFHGAMGSADSLIRGAQLEYMARDHDMILVAPDAINGLWAVPGIASEEKLAADLALFDQLIDRIGESHRIDRKRIYVTGMSQGASFALHLCSVRSETTAACVAHSHNPPRSVWDAAPSQLVPIMLVVGDTDQQASTDSVIRDAARYEQLGHEVELVVIEEWPHRWDRRQNDSIAEFLRSYRLE